MTSSAQLNRLLKKRLGKQKHKPAVGHAGLFNGSKPIQFHLRKSIKFTEIADFTRQLATMIQARVPLAKSLEILTKQQKNPQFQKIISEILLRLSQGKSFGDSLAPYPKYFSSFYINMVRVGEVTANMAEILNQLAVYLEKMGELKRKLLTAMTYPAIIVFVAVAAISFLLFFVMPTFTEMFQDFNTKVPLPTQILLDISAFIRTNWVYLLLAIIIVIWFFRKYFKTAKGSRIKDYLLLKLPLLGLVTLKVSFARFARTLGTLFGNGVSLLPSMDITIRSAGNQFIQQEIIQMKEMAEIGKPMEYSISNSRFFPPLLVQMIAVGEETAELPQTLIKTAEYYESQVDAGIDAMTSVIEPIIIVVLGVILGGVMIAIYLQIFDMMNVIQ